MRNSCTFSGRGSLNVSLSLSDEEEDSFVSMLVSVSSGVRRLRLNLRTHGWSERCPASACGTGGRLASLLRVGWRKSPW